MTITRNDIKNTISLLGGESISRIFALLLNIFIARHLGVAVFGKYCTALSYVLIFSVFMEMGLYILTLREISKNTAMASRYVVSALTIELAMSVITGGFMIILAHILGYPDDTRTAILILWIWVTGVALGRIVRNVFKAHQRMELDALLNITEALIKFVLVYMALTMGYGLTGSVLMIALSSVFVLILSIGMARIRYINFQFKPEWAFIRKIIAAALPFTLTILFTATLYRLDTVLLSLLRGDQEVGFYNAAYRITLTLFFIPALICHAFFPKLARLATADDTRGFSQLISSLFKSMILIVYPILMAVYILSPQIISLIYTNEYAASVTLLKILIWGNLLNAWSYVAINALNASGHEKKTAKALAAGLGINIVLNLILIPWQGCFGAVASHIASQLVIAILLGCSIKQKVCERRGVDMQQFARSGILIFVPFIVILWSESLGLTYKGTLGAFIIAYLTVIRLLKFITISDLGKLKQFLLFYEQKSFPCR